MRKYFLTYLVAAMSLVLALPLFATKFPLPPNGDALIGNIQHTDASLRDTTTTIAHHYNLGLNAVIAANPGTTETALGSRQIKVPTAFLLPPYRQGLIINLPEMRIYYYPKGSDVVMTFPIGIGKVGNTIPIRNTIVTRKKINPNWIPGPDVRKYNEEQGIQLPTVMPAGPDNPLGPYAIYLNIPSFLIHSTIFPESIGRRASFGCIRMNETDIKEFYPLVEPGTSVLILNMPNKIGWNGNKLYLEAHPPLDEHNVGFDSNRENIVNMIQSAIPKNSVAFIDWQLVAHLAEEPDGVPHEIGTRIN